MCSFKRAAKLLQMVRSMKILKIKDVAVMCFSSRVIMIILQIICNHMIPDHLHSMRDVFWHGRRTPQPYNHLIEAMLGGYTRWDSEYFLHIAEHGYQYEQCLAFFPLYPSFVHVSHKLLLYTVPMLSSKDAILVSAVAINIGAFVMTGLLLYQLTNRMFHRPSISHITVILYCITPANVFMTTTYSEAMFMLLVISGLLCLHHHHDWVTTVIFMLAGYTRSNGILLAGFLVWYHWLTLVTANSILMALTTVLKSLVQVSMIISSFVLYQLLTYQLFCHDSTTPPEWCGHTIPISYTHIQRQYWDVGWLRYYQLKQIPNFLLASPTIILCSHWLICCYRSNWNKMLKGYDHWYWSNNQLIPLIVHLTFLLFFAVTSMHVQVITRLIYSSTPLVYWSAAVNVLEALPNMELSGSSLMNDCWMMCKQLYSTSRCYVAKTIVTFSLLYSVIGTLLHCNYYPWT